MTYAGGEADILTRLQAMSDWSTDNSARADWLLLNNGKSAKYAIIRAGEHSQNPEFASVGGITKFQTWRSVIEVWQKFDTPGTDITATQALVDSIINELWKYPYLGDGATSGQVLLSVDGSEMQERWIAEGGPKWAVWEVIVDWQEEKTISPAE